MSAAFQLRLRQKSQETIEGFVHLGVNLENLTGLALKFFIKTSDVTLDSDASTVVLGTATGEILVTDALKGEFTITIPPQPAAGTFWGRLDIINGSLISQTAACGPVIIAAC